jgi:tetratricopeptide (TPR) repeat protein
VEVLCLNLLVSSTVANLNAEALIGGCDRRGVMYTRKAMPKLFVIMPFGTECEIDFDRVFFNLIQPAAKDARLEVLRMDQVSTPGRISDQTLRELYLADVALADVTAPNPNVFYELGIRQTMGRPTVLIARRNTVLPFDIREQRVLLYHAETDQQILEARTAIASALGEVLREPGQNPVQQFLNSIGATTSPAGDTAAFEHDLRGRLDRARNANQLIAIWKSIQHFDRLPPLTLADMADRLAKFEEWGFAMEVLREAVRIRSNDFELHRSLGLYSRKIGDYETAEKCFRQAIELNPSDPETLGMLGGLLKRSERFAEAAEVYARGAGIAPSDIYLRSNSIAMLLIAEPKKRADALKQYQQLRKDLLALPPDKRDQWTECMTAEVHFVLGEDGEAHGHFDLFVRLAKSPNELLSPADQFDLLARHGFRSEESAEMAAWLRKMHRQLMEPQPLRKKLLLPRESVPRRSGQYRPLHCR